MNRPLDAAAAWQRLQQLNRLLLAQPSASAVLEAWCGGTARGLRLQVRKYEGPARPLPPGLQARLQLAAGELPLYRRVALCYAGQTLSEADNWYCPERVEVAMQQALQDSDRPFGEVVRALDFRRERLSIDWLWQPGEAAPRELPWHVLRHQALLRRADGRPFSAVVETYTRPVLALAWPGADPEGAAARQDLAAQES